LYVPFTSSSENDFDSEEENDITLYAADGTVWTRKEEVSGPGKRKYKSKFNKDYGPTGHTKRNIMPGNFTSALSLIVDDKMLDYIKYCTELEASLVLEKNGR
jgi:hypothetical protein